MNSQRHTARPERRVSPELGGSQRILADFEKVDFEKVDVEKAGVELRSGVLS